jgi:hypothetical protein
MDTTNDGRADTMSGCGCLSPLNVSTAIMAAALSTLGHRRSPDLQRARSPSAEAIRLSRFTRAGSVDAMRPVPPSATEHALNL